MGLALLLVTLIVRIWDPLLIEALRLRSFDLFQILHPREAVERPVIIVDIDEESLAAVGQWPWPRTLLATMLENLYQAGTLAVGFDIVFPEPDRMSPHIFGETIGGLDQELLTLLKQLPSNDRVFAEALAKGKSVLGQSGYQRRLGENAGVVKRVPVATVGQDPRHFLVQFPGIIRNTPELEQAAAGLALFTLLPERDGVIRRVPAMTTVGYTIVPALALELLRLSDEKQTGDLQPILIRTDDAGVRNIVVGEIEVPTDRRGRIWINFSSFDERRYLSAKDVLAGSLAPGSLAGKLVIIGSSATGLFDVKVTPLYPAMPGVEVHAQLIETVLEGSYLHRPNYALGAEIILTLGAGIFAIILVPLLGAFYTLVLGAALSATLFGGSWYLYMDSGTLVDVSFPMAASFSVFSLMLFVNYFREEGDRRNIRNAFRQYLSPELVDELVRHPDQLVLGGEIKQMSFLFCDVRGFTMISELYKADPQGLTRLMNRLLTPLSNEIVRYQGTIDKYMGDAIMAFWNAPLEDPRHPLNACNAALAMLKRLDILNEQRRQEAKVFSQPFLPLRLGVGINTGECVVGNLGSDLHFDYSVLGDSVNLASRLEGQSKLYGVSIIVGSRTASAVTRDFALVELDLVRVLGKMEPETIFALVGDSVVAASSEFSSLVGFNNEMLAAYRKRRWMEALEALENCRLFSANFGLESFYETIETRIREFIVAPPPDNWNGVFTSDDK
ncbi:CHASE2 domain-containing protein [Denitrobaculum tricleocarpae]|uniref:Adenylate/guanylate cyclase domain-containing protein n=1 Tax=Denitrobaculum tricleocarpae TaxID=2591009 RepID=A0A545U1G0_9PROT|nr:adenylate/guanylate cyclase domain-containing protein [Denitrobaculum tricleocarpae]TQV83305.1 adenylate/guanylate cyclase domain-containing protein [Denitrobaculum tricleocarpae]